MRIFLILFCCLFFTSRTASAMTVEEAYRAIPHAQTTFDPDQKKMSPGEAEYLSAFFFLTDMALRDRVEAVMKIDGHDGIAVTEYNNRQRQLMKSLDSMETPPPLEKVYKLIIDALREQKDFLNFLAGSNAEQQKEMLKKLGEQELVKSSHAKLTEAYRQLLELYPTEEAHNKQAFYDHLCALDFI